jgi:hypothetical protein
MCPLEIRSSVDSFRTAADEAVNSARRQLAWGLFDRYEVQKLDGGTEPCFYAPVDLPAGLQTFYLLINRYLRNPWMEDQGLTTYSPLNVPGLFLEFASLVEDPGLDDEPHTDNNEAVALDWISSWGVLGLTPTGFDSLTGRIHQGGKDDSLSSFVRQAGFANVTLRLYEAATALEGPDIDFIQRGMPEERWSYYAQNPTEARNWAMKRVAKVVEFMLEEYCYPTFHLQEDGQVALAWGFKNLLGAMWIQMMWLLTSTGKTRRCARPECTRIITFESRHAPIDPGLKKNPRGKYKTRSDKKFCTALCRVKNHQQNQRQRNS